MNEALYGLLQSLSLAEIITLLTTVVALFVALERLVNAVSAAIISLTAFVQVLLRGADEPDTPQA